jgi:hypothetical protein
MSQANLDDLERDVEDARNRLLHDVGRLRAPATLSGFKDDVVVKAQEVRDEWVHKATDAASSSVQRIWSDLVDRASANPGAALVIGAGLAWRLAHRSPIATLVNAHRKTSTAPAGLLCTRAPIAQELDQTTKRFSRAND